MHGRSRSHDALRARGIIPERAPSRSPSPELPTAEEVRDARRKHATVADLDEELEEADDDEERILLQLRMQRMKEISAMHSHARFGRVYPIARPDYTRDVTDASKASLPGATDPSRGTGVVCFLYKPGYVSLLTQNGHVRIGSRLPGYACGQAPFDQIREHCR